MIIWAGGETKILRGRSRMLSNIGEMSRLIQLKEDFLCRKSTCTEYMNLALPDIECSHFGRGREPLLFKPQGLPL